jgi:acetate kinase
MIEECGLRILTINTGSSSFKSALYEMGRGERLLLSAQIERIGLKDSLFRIEAAGGETLIAEKRELPDHDAALQALLGWLRSNDAGAELDAVGHRVVHGGATYTRPSVITPRLVRTLEEMVPLAPDHLPQALRAIRAVERSFPTLRQVACFDTAFHRRMPRVAQLYALPRSLSDQGIIRYGFHGLSYEYIMQELKDKAGARAAADRVIIAHLGNGASMAAVHRGKGVDTTMGFTPTAGLVMSTRSGDLDPGIILYLLREKGLDASGVNDLVNERAGLLGVSGVSADMKDLLSEEATNPQAAEAVALFCYQAKKFLGGLSAVLGGLDTLIFTGGIGENASPVRERICEGMGFIGIQLDLIRNRANASVISRDDSPTTVRVMKTNEELMIARHTGSLVRGKLRTNRLPVEGENDDRLDLCQ